MYFTMYFGDLLKTEYFILAPLACVETHVGGTERVRCEAF